MRTRIRIGQKVCGRIGGCLFCLVITGFAHGSASRAAHIEAYVRPYVRNRNFSGAVFVSEMGKVIFERGYGSSDREKHIRNTPETRFHVASVSMQFTAAAVLRLHDMGALGLDEHVSGFAPQVDGGDRITIRDLLMQRSGLPDINNLPDYDDVLQHHQTPASLVAKIGRKPLLFEPGSKFQHEEHSAYNLLALIVEKKTGKPFATAVEQSVFQPLGLSASGIDDDTGGRSVLMAKGYEPTGADELKPARPLHWSAKTGNGSAYTTAIDAGRWVREEFTGRFLSIQARDLIRDTSTRVGYGWFRDLNRRFGQPAYSMNGRAPGFSSFVLYLPEADLTVVVLSNIYSSATTTIGYDIAAIALGLPYSLPHFVKSTPAELKGYTGTFQFGPDFYQPNAKVSVVLNGRHLAMQWPSGETSVLLPVGPAGFIDRSYWTEVNFERGESGKPAVLVYGPFRGHAIDP